jgi:hypothetical protein
VSPWAITFKSRVIPGTSLILAYPVNPYTYYYS